MGQNLALFAIVQCSGPESSFFFVAIVQCSEPESVALFVTVQCSMPVPVAPAELWSPFSPFRLMLGHRRCQIRILRRSVKMRISSLMWQHCRAVGAANVWIAQLRNLQECRCCPVWFAGLSLTSARFVRLPFIMAKLPSCRLWRHAVWQWGTNVSKGPAACSLYSSTQMLICMWSVNGYRRTQPLQCKSRGVTWSCLTAVIRLVITEIHKELLLCVSLMMGLMMALRLKHVARCCRKNERFLQHSSSVRFYLRGWLYLMCICFIAGASWSS